MMLVVLIEPRPLGDADLDVLLASALAELRRRYPDFGAGRPHDPATVFLVAVVDGAPAGCVGVRRLDASRGEMKRLFVVPECRGRGVARGLLREAERLAVTAGYRQLLLETGVAQPEAIAVFLSSGYRPIAPYEGNFTLTDDSRCFAKVLAAAP